MPCDVLFCSLFDACSTIDGTNVTTTDNVFVGSETFVDDLNENECISNDDCEGGQVGVAIGSNF